MAEQHHPNGTRTGPTLRDARELMQAIAAAEVCSTCKKSRVAVATGQRDRTGRLLFTETCRCVRCAGCHAKAPVGQLVERAVINTETGEAAAPVRICTACAERLDAMEAA